MSENLNRCASRNVGILTTNLKMEGKYVTRCKQQILLNTEKKPIITRIFLNFIVIPNPLNINTGTHVLTVGDSKIQNCFFYTSKINRLSKPFFLHFFISKV